MYLLLNTEPFAICYSCEKGIKQHILTVCVCSINYPVRNNHVTCHISVIGLYSHIKLYTHSCVSDREKLNKYKIYFEML
jgi:hypothetical protein